MFSRGEKLLFRTAGKLISPGKSGGRLLILTYHRVLNDLDPLMPDNIDADIFDMQMSVVKEIFCPLPLYKAVELLKKNLLPPRAVAITFDDGYADNYEVALPILKKYAVPATVFVASGYLNGGIMWNDAIIEAIRAAKTDKISLPSKGMQSYRCADQQQKRNAIKEIINTCKYLPWDERKRVIEEMVSTLNVTLPDNLMLTDEQLIGLQSAGVEIGGHTISHPILAKLDDQRADMEINECKEDLHELTGSAVYGFAYPNGKPGVDYMNSHAATVKKAGYTYAVSTSKGYCRSKEDVFQLPRYSPWEREPRKFAARMIMASSKPLVRFA